MYLAAGRDVDATFFLDRRLSEAREQLIAAVLAGAEPDPDFWEQRERTVLLELKSTYFNATLRQAFGLDGSLTDEEDYSSHSQKLLERAMWWTHERMKTIPFVGQEGFGDD